MKASELQKLARNRNWALFQLKSMQGNLIALKRAGVDCEGLQDILRNYEELVKRKFSRERNRLLQEKIKSILKD